MAATTESVKADAAKASKEELVEVTLKKPHSHKGVHYKDGDKILVSEDEMNWLKMHQVI